MKKKVHARLSGFTIRDTTHPDFMQNLKADIEKNLRNSEYLQMVWVKEIIIGKEVSK